MKVEIWSDIACPYCYIGKHKFESALEQFANKDEVEVVYRSFELDPEAKRDVNYDVYDYRAAKYGMTRDQAIEKQVGLVKQGNAVGVALNYDSLILTNTFDALRLTHFAARYGKKKEMIDLLYQAYFTDSKHLGDHETLINLAAEIGLNRDETAEVLAGDDYADEVRADEREGERIGIQGVPFFVINGEHGISGAVPTEMFLRVLQKASEEEKERPLTVLNGSTNTSGEEECADGSCHMPQRPIRE